MRPSASDATNIALVGAPGTGKTTLAQNLVLPLKLAGKDAVFVGEPARVFLRRSGPYQHWLEDVPIFLETVQQEEEMQQHQMLVYDSASFAAAAYMQFYRPKNLSKAEALKWEYCYRLLSGLARDRHARFQQVFFVPSGRFALTEDPTRKWSEGDAGRLGEMLHAYLVANGIAFHEVASVGPQARLGEVLGVLHDRGLIDEIPPLVPKD